MTARAANLPLDDEDDSVPPEVLDRLYGVAMAAGGANVVMQLARLPIGHGVARSKVDSGRVDKHPLKRLRTTTAYLAVAMLGTREERLGLRREINRAHAHVRSEPGDEVTYDAFDPELQLWVAACLYKGFEDVIGLVEGRLDRDLVDGVLYPHARRLATTLQVPAEMWPTDRDAFEEYWQQGVASIEMDDLTRAYLRTIVEGSFLVAPLGKAARPLRPFLAPSSRFMTLGFLPEEFRRELRMPFSEAEQRRHRQFFRALGTLNRSMPGPLRRLPLNVYLYDTRRRLRAGRAVV